MLNDLLGLDVMMYRKQFHELNSLVSLLSMLQSNKDVLGLADQRQKTENLLYLGLVSDLLGLISHEYFHTWNVKRIKPAAFVPYDLTQENYTRLLWAFEGFTSYYDDLMLVRSGLLTERQYLETLAKTLTTVLQRTSRLKQSVADSSFDAWIKYYRQDENAPNAIVSYYLKGSLVAWGLDVELRRRTGDSRSLDDLMRLVWSRNGASGRGLAEGELEALAAELCGCDLRAFFDRYVRGTDELPVTDWCEALGLGIRLRAAKDERDEGGALAVEPAEMPPARPSLGVRTRRAADGVGLLTVFDGSPAQRAGLSAGDLIVAVGGIRASAESLPQLLSRVPAGQSVTIHAFRRDELLALDVCLEPAPADTCDLWLLAPATAGPAQLGRRDRWLGGG